jgi:thiol-disulfide isomerase/thioredoxin
VVKQTLRDVRRLPLSTVLLACVAAAAVAAIAVGLLFGGSGGDEAAGDGTAGTIVLEEDVDAVGQPVGEGAFDTLDGGESSLASYQGTPVVLNFFASWCVPCITEMPAFEEVHQAMGDEVAFVGLAVRDEVPKTEELVDDTGVTYDIGRDQRGDVLTSLGGFQLPTTVLIDADGVVTSVNTGELGAEELTTMIEAELLA